ncbi:MAG: hypothetical protein IKR48_02195 [Kiritimatiellae bacterium]|nr:hypothetical protein [Kiritimatiellia bacterium]
MNTTLYFDETMTGGSLSHQLEGTKTLTSRIGLVYRRASFAFLVGLLVPSVQATWTPGEPVTTYWAGPGYPGNDPLSDKWLAQLKEGGFNTVWATSVEELDLAAKYGMRVIFRIPDISDKILDLPEAEESATAKLIARIKNHPALYIYSIHDEPPVSLFAPLARKKTWIGRHDPNHAVWVNLLPTYANNKQLGVEGEIIRAYWEHVRLFGEIFRPEFITYDHYQFTRNGDNPNYLLNLGIIRQSAAAQNVPFWNGVQACTWVPGSAASPSSPRIPGSDEMRFLVYTTAAYGAQGIYYYVYCRQGHEGSIVALDGTPDEKFHVSKDLNREFISLAKELATLRFTGAYLQGVHAPGSTPWCEQALLKITPETPASELQPKKELTDTTLVSRFEAPGKPTHLMVVNLDYRKDRNIRITAPSKVSKFDALKRTWTSIESNSFDLMLLRGSGVLLRLH